MAWRRWGGTLLGRAIDWEELHSASRALEARVGEARAGHQERQRCVQRLASGRVDEEQEPSDALNYLLEDDLPSEIPRADGARRALEGFSRRNQQHPGPHRGSDDPSASA